MIEFVQSSWPVICILVGVGFSCGFAFGYKRGYRSATADHYGPAALQQSAADLGATDSPDGSS